LTFTRFVVTPENRSAHTAVRQVAACLCSSRWQRVVNPLYLHGPAGAGKTHLVSALADEVSRQARHLTITTLAAGDGNSLLSSPQQSAPSDSIAQAARDCDLLIIEDLQHLARRGKHPMPAVAEALVQVFDDRLARQQQMVFTATVGPGHLSNLSRRLTSRLGCGLVVGLEPLQPASRLLLLEAKAQSRQLAVRREVLQWVAQHVRGSVRELEGALVQLEMLSRWQRQPLDVATVAGHFRTQVEAARPTVERIAQHVSSYYQVDSRQLQSPQRYHKVLLPRQVGMYLARQLTDLSLAQIGHYFGGRDHSTVLHACQKIERALAGDVLLSGAVRQLQTALA
jgi:chromosomal replication initiator protein